MEMNRFQKLKAMKWKEIFLGEAKPFENKREVNWPLVKRVAITGGVFVLLWILFMPSQTPEEKTFHERVDQVKSSLDPRNEMNPTVDTLQQFAKGEVDTRTVPTSLDHLYAPSSMGGSGSGLPSAGGSESSMIRTRGGMDSHTQLPPGTRIRVRILENAKVSSQSLPVVGLVLEDVEQNGGTAIPSGSKLYGDIGFDDQSDRGSVTFRTIRLPDGRERPISGISLGLDGQSGIDGKVHSESVKNTIGQTITRFVGAYADGAMERGAMGESSGGTSNGLKNAVAETARDRADAFGKSLSLERKWFEVAAGTEFFMILNQSFTFREPGAFNGG